MAASRAALGVQIAVVVVEEDEARELDAEQLAEPPRDGLGGHEEDVRPVEPDQPAAKALPADLEVHRPALRERRSEAGVWHVLDIGRARAGLSETERDRPGHAAPGPMSPMEPGAYSRSRQRIAAEASSPSAESFSNWENCSRIRSCSVM